jgi:hypothetical protein
MKTLKKHELINKETREFESTGCFKKSFTTFKVIKLFLKHTVYSVLGRITSVRRIVGAGNLT